ncbi:MAG TPA: hypothetical protein VGK58_06415 [Lacipirellulaceae bacterium]
MSVVHVLSMSLLFVQVTVADELPRQTATADEANVVNPFDPEVPRQLTRMKRSVSLGRIHPPTQKVKAALRERLGAEPNAELAWALATIISNGLSATDLLFDAPSDGGSTKQDREDPDESYATLAKVLEIGLQTAPPKSDLWRRFGLSLAKVRLLQGDWAGMDAVLEQLGQSPIPESQRANLPAPPPDWNNLLGTWQPGDESMRTGMCAIEFQFEKDGKGLAGAHVLVKHPRDPQLRAYSGIRADTLLLARRPLVDDRFHGTFGYHARDRAMTRYAVSDASGKIRIEGLPKIPVVVEVLVPTSNFPERGHSWDLLMELAPGDLRPTEWGEPDSIRGNKEGPSIAVLKENDTVHYPKLIVRPQLEPNLTDWTEVDADDFVLEWQSLAHQSAAIDRYEVEMMLTAPSQIPHMVTQQRVIQSSKEAVRETRWEIGANGVGGKRLRPGNIYMLEVRALDRQNKVVARLPRTRVWVPWTHRNSSPPVHDVRAIREVPIYDRVWWQGRTIQRGQRPIELREAVTTYLSANADAFEYEYVLLGQAWLNCLDGFSEAERVVLEELAEDLPEGNVVRGTARSLLNLLDDGKPLPKRLEFVADE